MKFNSLRTLDYSLFSYLNLLLALVAVFVAVESHANTETGFLNRTIKVDGKQSDFTLYLPKDYDQKEKWPLIVFLHGAGERGSDGVLPTNIGIGKSIRQDHELYPAVVVFPQCPAGSWWSNEDCTNIVDEISKKYIESPKTDKKRVYLTGLSMGGYGVYYFGARHENRWAALWSLSGRGIPGGGHKPSIGSVAHTYSGDDVYRYTAKSISDVPVWLVHGERDMIVPVSESRKIFNYLKLFNAPAHYKEYPGGVHNIWDEAYSDKEMVEWLFSQSRDE